MYISSKLKKNHSERNSVYGFKYEYVGFEKSEKEGLSSTNCPQILRVT